MKAPVKADEAQHLSQARIGRFDINSANPDVNRQPSTLAYFQIRKLPSMEMLKFRAFFGQYVAGVENGDEGAPPLSWFATGPDAWHATDAWQAEHCSPRGLESRPLRSLSKETARDG